MTLPSNPALHGDARKRAVLRAQVSATRKAAFNSIHTENNMSTNVIVTFKAKPEKLAEFVNLLNQAKHDLPKVASCKVFRIFNDVNDPCTLTLVETWASETDHKKIWKAWWHRVFGATLLHISLAIQQAVTTKNSKAWQ